MESRSSTTKAQSAKRLLQQPPSGADIHSPTSEATLSSFVSWLMDRRGNTSMALSSSAMDRAVVGHVFSSSVLKILRPPLLLAALGSSDAVTCQELRKLHIVWLASICGIGPVLDAFKLETLKILYEYDPQDNKIYKFYRAFWGLNSQLEKQLMP